MQIWKRWSAWLCLSLLLWTAAAESTHHHPNRTDAATCAVCLAAHSSSPAASSGHGTPVFAAVGVLSEEVPVFRVRLDFSDAGIRGPPVL